MRWGRDSGGATPVEVFAAVLSLIAGMFFAYRLVAGLSEGHLADVLTSAVTLGFIVSTLVAVRSAPDPNDNATGNGQP